MENKTKEVTTIPELSGTTIDDVMQEFSGKMTPNKAKKALAEMKQRFIDLAFENGQLETKKKRVEMQIKQHPTMKAYYELKKQIRNNKKLMKQYAAVYQGGLQLAKSLGIKVDMSVVKMIAEGQDNGSY